MVVDVLFKLGARSASKTWTILSDLEIFARHVTWLRMLTTEFNCILPLRCGSSLSGCRLQLPARSCYQALYAEGYS